MGSLLLVWARLEKSVRDEISRITGIPPSKPHGICALLKAWEKIAIKPQPAESLCPRLARSLRRQLQAPLDIRNGLCHGLNGIIQATEQMPAALHWEMNREEQSISWDELQVQLGWLSRLPRAFQVMSDPQLERHGNRAADTPENRAWWRSEFALELPDE